jgi:hypothetical protein
LPYSNPVKRSQKRGCSASTPALALRFFAFQSILRRQQNRRGAAVCFGDDPNYVELKINIYYVLRFLCVWIGRCPLFPSKAIGARLNFTALFFTVAALHFMSEAILLKSTI